MKTTITALFTLTLVFISFKSLTRSTGPDPNLSNAPGDGNCTSCHSTPGTLITTGPVFNSMDLGVVGATLSTLVQGTTYSFNLTFSDASSAKYGFQLCVLEAGADGSTPSLGTLISPTSATQIINGGNRDYLEHTSNGTTATSNSITWNFQWQTPASYVGGATFYVVVNSTDEDNAPSLGDVIYAKTFSANVAMPVNWLYAKTSKNNDNVTLNWATASEENNWKFIVEKSINKKEWLAIGEVKGKGNSSVVNKYVFTEAGAKDAAFYRIKQVDYNGEFSYSVVMVTKNETVKTESKVVYNIDRSGYIIKGNDVKNINVISMNGEVKYTKSDLTNGYEIPTLARGLYIVEIKTENETYYQKLLMD
jgi:hypothetical protein